MPAIAEVKIRSINKIALAQRLLYSHAPLQSTPVTTPDVTGMLILVVDDNQLNQDAISRILCQQNINVVTVDNAITAIELVDSLRPDLILIDLQMSELDDCQAIKRIRKHYDKQQLPIFALAAHSEVEDKARTAAVGLNKYLTKPVAAATLVREIGQLNLTASVFFDRPFALAQFADNEDLMVKMLQKFALLCDSQLNLLETHLEQSELQLLVHNIKGVSGSLGFMRLSQVAQKIETNIRTASNAHAQVLITELRTHLKQVLSYLQVQGLIDVTAS
ncbi:MAG: Hpt domain-containing response regulator [Pseudoalteromonas sp.]|uniref:response regulator n=1 Tax=unclassified Pseudoalteromonas TaxID=194690 RepID=UPI003F959E83